MIEVKNSVNPKSDVAQGIKKLYERFLQQGKIPSELEPLSFYIACDTPANYSMVVSTSEKPINVKVVNVKKLEL